MYFFYPTSSNKKTGDIPQVYSRKATCPDNCGLKKRGCYAATGCTNIFWLRLNKGGISIVSLAKKIKALADKTLWRYGVAGDLPGRNNEIDASHLNRIVEANTNKMGYAYTHKPVLFGAASKETIINNRKSIKKALSRGFMVNLSADSLAGADRLKALNLAPIVVILPSTQREKSFLTPGGNKVIVCPAAYNTKVTCATCKLCARQRSVIVGFPAHGISTKYIDNMLSK